MDQVDFEEITQLVDALKDQREVSAAQPVNKGQKNWRFFTFTGEYYIWEFYSVAASELRLNTILGIVAVSCIGILFIPHWSAVLFVASFITILYVDLMGILQFAGIHINPVSYIALGKYNRGGQLLSAFPKLY
jgi:Niemann-Pick C1 protein